LRIAWKNWLTRISKDYIDGVNIADLWVIVFYLNQEFYTQQLTSMLYVYHPFLVPFVVLSRQHRSHEPGSYNWVINIDEPTMSITSKFVSRFLASGVLINSTLSYIPEIYSSGFLIIQAPSSSATTTTSSSPSFSFPSTASTSSTASTASTCSILRPQPPRPLPLRLPIFARLCHLLYWLCLPSQRPHRHLQALYQVHQTLQRILPRKQLRRRNLAPVPKSELGLDVESRLSQC